MGNVVKNLEKMVKHPEKVVNILKLISTLTHFDEGK
jgi:hypothetical protein